MFVSLNPCVNVYLFKTGLQKDTTFVDDLYARYEGSKR